MRFIQISNQGFDHAIDRFKILPFDFFEGQKNNRGLSLFGDDVRIPADGESVEEALGGLTAYLARKKMLEHGEGKGLAKASGAGDEGDFFFGI